MQHSLLRLQRWAQPCLDRSGPAEIAEIDRGTALGNGLRADTRRGLGLRAEPGGDIRNEGPEMVHQIRRRAPIRASASQGLRHGRGDREKPDEPARCPHGPPAGSEEPEGGAGRRPRPDRRATSAPRPAPGGRDSPPGSANPLYQGCSMKLEARPRRPEPRRLTTLGQQPGADRR